MSEKSPTHPQSGDQAINKEICYLWAGLLERKISAACTSEDFAAIEPRIKALKDFAHKCGFCKEKPN